MGAGGQTSKKLRRVPYSKPPFTLAEIKAAVPPHCFKRSVLLSFYYLIQDFASAFLFYSLATNYIHLLPSPLSYLAWSIYWIFQSSVLGGMWVIAHECNHHAFSDYQWLDDTVGFILHSALLVPYFSWKYSHRRHHSNTGSIHYDEVFVPKLKYRISWYAKYINNPAGRILKIFFSLTLGWFSYLLFNIESREYDRFACHFDPYSPIYSDRERLQILISDAGVLAVVYGLYCLVTVKGLAWVLCVYGAPIIIVNAGLVLVTWLHHTHPALPHYDSSEWDWLRGALSTVDRDYGIMNRVLHNITNTHVAHHLFSTMPHYHAMEATKAIRPVLGDYYRFDRTPIYTAMWRETKECIYVEADESDQSKGVLWYTNKL